jgi:DUF1365 family protein
MKSRAAAFLFSREDMDEADTMPQRMRGVLHRSYDLVAFTWNALW